MKQRHRTTRITVLAPAIALGVGALVAGPAQAAAPITNCRMSTNSLQDLRALYLDQVESELHAQINRFRAANGVPKLISATSLQRAAAWASHDSAARGHSPKDHVDTLGRDIPTRLTQCGVTGLNRVSEINYYGWGGSSRPADAMHWWTVESPKLGLRHRDILLDPGLKSFGVGRAVNGDKTHWTVTFGDKVIGKRLGKRPS
ncbi:CAP domain-containing protein [Nonomuraea dietziae]|uniref:Uncharacterized protein YkwD n=1 Tax=Nonomuraea dietziae TaxID=65515 RepID=A0A7W5UY70_9ACTN|nr:CAP domain-containing protein [Nonomuraea dietziae]MBB3725189.1 uncharacterized protein YkwD [Nonomuraea dietziae]